MNDTLYLQLDQNIEVHHPHVYLQDIARLSCTNAKLLNRLRVLPVANLDPEKPGRYVMTAMDLVDLIQKKEPELTITHIGEPDFILTYKKTGASHQLFHIVKTAFVCLISFFGAAFSIMTFNTDADVGKLFRQIYEQVTGSVVLFFFNHFSRVKITSDPSPMQVQMRIYEDQVNSTVIEDINRKQAAEHQEPS